MKLLAIDLDDTLLRDDNTVSDYTKAVLKKAQHKGIEVLIATGRMYQTAYPVAHRLGLGDVPMVLYSGGVIQRVESKELIWERAIPPEVARKVLAITKEHNIYIQSYIDDELLVHSETEFSRLYEEITGAKAVYVGDAIYAPQKGTNKLLVVEEPERMTEVIAILSKEVGHMVDLVRSKVNFLEIVAPHVSKGEALAFMGERLGIGLEDMVSFGNSENDISMLQATGHSVAVGNAEDHVKTIAKEVCDTNENDGVAKWIEANVL